MGGCVQVGEFGITEGDEHGPGMACAEFVQLWTDDDVSESNWCEVTYAYWAKVERVLSDVIGRAPMGKDNPTVIALCPQKIQLLEEVSADGDDVVKWIARRARWAVETCRRPVMVLW